MVDPSSKANQVREWDVLSKKDFPTKQLAQRELDKIISRANGETRSVLPSDLRAVEVLLCDSCRQRLLSALSASK